MSNHQVTASTAFARGPQLLFPDSEDVLYSTIPEEREGDDQLAMLMEAGEPNHDANE